MGQLLRVDAPAFFNKSKEEYSMETIESLHKRVEVLEHQIEALANRAHVIERRLRWWCALACGLLALGLFSLPLPSSTAQEESAEYRGIRKRLAALEYKLQYISGGLNEVVITGANLRIVNGLGSTLTTNGLGNLIVGYNEPRHVGNEETGSHNIVVGFQHSFTSFGGLVAGAQNDIRGDFATVSGGSFNVASGVGSMICGGVSNIASGVESVVCGGQANTASGTRASISGGNSNTAAGFSSSVSGGLSNLAESDFSSVSGGQRNTATGFDATSVSGGLLNTASGFLASVSGGALNTAFGDFASVSGGLENLARGSFSSVSGGRENSALSDSASVSGGFKGQLPAQTTGRLASSPPLTDFYAGFIIRGSVCGEPGPFTKLQALSEVFLIGGFLLPD
jgi:hypothetical protein